MGEKGGTKRINVFGFILPASPFIMFFAVILCVLSCAQSRKIASLERDHIGTSIKLPDETLEEDMISSVDPVSFPRHRDTIKVIGLDGREMLLMRAIKDETTGEMVATEELNAAVVTARFRHTAERGGKVKLEFQVIVPEQMRDSKWQLRLHPDLFILEDSLRLDDVIVTGDAYRKAQIRGYQHYNRFLKRIITDSLKLVDMRNLEIFISRNIPALYAYKNDSTFVSEEEFRSSFGVTEEDAIKHYTYDFLLRRNARLSSLREKKWNRYIKAPIVSEGIRLDTVMRGDNGEFVYNYAQIIDIKPKLKKAEIKMSGEIFEQDMRLYTIPPSEPLTFYISSVSSFADRSEKYLTKIISRNVETNASSSIDFHTGRSEVDERLAGNDREIRKIKSRLKELVCNDSFVLDSIIIVASASPEGKWESNLQLSYRRAQEVSKYFSRYIDYIRDSLRMEDGLFVNVEDYSLESGMTTSLRSRKKIDFISRSGGEDWTMLDVLVESDSLLSSENKEHYKMMSKEEDADRREVAIRAEPYYKQLKDRLYPQLRRVRFDFHLHRKGMVKDTVHTTVLDSTYMTGVNALIDHDYEKAAALLSPYRDFNAALACLALNRNVSAKSILDECSKTAKVNYLYAILYSREGRDRDAVECYLRSCEQDGSFVHRGKLDPEIAILIDRYNINKDI